MHKNFLYNEREVIFMAQGSKKTVSVLIPEELYEEVSTQAKRSSRSMSAYIRQVLKAHLQYLERFRNC